MKINYNITIRLKNQDWYDQAEEFGEVKEFEEWDDQRTPRYRREVAFRFLFDVSAINEQKSTCYPLKLIDGAGLFQSLELPGLRVFSFVGGNNSEQLVVSETLIDQAFIEDQNKGRGKVYVYVYIKSDVNCYEVSDNIWLSEEHFNYLDTKIKHPYKVVTPEVEPILSGGILS